MKLPRFFDEDVRRMKLRVVALGFALLGLGTLLGIVLQRLVAP